MLMMKLLFLVTILLATSCYASIEMYERHGWQRLGRVDAQESVEFTMALRNRNMPQLKAILESVSDIENDSYGHYLSRQQIVDLVAPDQAIVKLVSAYLREIGSALSVQLGGHDDFLHVKMSSIDCERMFGVELHRWAHPLFGGAADARFHRIAADRVPQIPAAILKHIDVVSGLRELPLSNGAKRRWALMQSSSSSSMDSDQVNVDGIGSSVAAPLVTVVTASQENVVIDLVPKCADGNTTGASIEQLCSDASDGNVLSGLLVTLTDKLTSEVTTTRVQLAGSTTTPLDYAASCDAAGDATSCTVTVRASRPYRTVYVNVTSLFEKPSPAAEGAWNNFYNVAVIQSAFITPQNLHSLYKIPQDLTASGASQAIASFDRQYWSETDLAKFSGITGVPVANVTTHGFNDFAAPGDEAQLDISMVTALGINARTSFYSVAVGYLLEWASIVLKQSTIETAHSISYSDSESDLHNYGPNWAERVDAELVKFGTRGATVLAAAGDAGVSSIGHGTDSCAFSPQYPASSEYILSIGATVVTPNTDPLCGTEGYGGEPVTCDDHVLGEVVVAADNGCVWTSGSGTSTRTSRPSWQDDAAAAYMSGPIAKPPSGSWNASGRIYPDLSGVGSNLIIVLHGKVDVAGGTSASTPISAGIISTLNAVRLRHGKPTLGFVNPLLYKAGGEWPSVYNDIVVGDTRCGDVLHPPHVACCDDGFNAGIGFDYASGWGSFNWPEFVKFMDHQ
jgi:tripeptidyl-peptidase I